MTDLIKYPRPILFRDPATGQMRTSENGCWAYHDCLSCPLPRCVHDSHVTPAIAARATTRQDVLELAQQGLSADDIAPLVAVSRRTVFRHLDSIRKMKARSPRAAAPLVQ